MALYTIILYRRSRWGRHFASVFWLIALSHSPSHTPSPLTLTHPSPSPSHPHPHPHPHPQIGILERRERNHPFFALYRRRLSRHSSTSILNWRLWRWFMWSIHVALLLFVLCERRYLVIKRSSTKWEQDLSMWGYKVSSKTRAYWSCTGVKPSKSFTIELVALDIWNVGRDSWSVAKVQLDSSCLVVAERSFLKRDGCSNFDTIDP